MNNLKFIVSIFFFITALLSSTNVVLAAESKDRLVSSIDLNWPKPLPHKWLLGQVSGVSIDSKNNIWVLQRPSSLTSDEDGADLNPPVSYCCRKAPPVIEFDQKGNVIRAWGGPAKAYDWPSKEHSIFVDNLNYVWIDGSGDNDGQLLKFTMDGKFVLQIGKPGKQTNSNDISRLGQPAGIYVDNQDNEVYVADGYYNHRVIVFDATTGKYKRHWDAYGRRPLDHYPEDKLNIKQRVTRTNPATPQQLLHFGNAVHCVHVSNDGLVYVCDRINNRIQVFHKDGKFVQEFFIRKETLADGSVWDLVFSNDPAQRYLYVLDGRNNQLYTVIRKTGQLVETTGHAGRYPGQFHWGHDLASDALGNLYIGEVDSGKRIQKFQFLKNP